MGCIRMHVSDLKRIHDNCPSDTTVEALDSTLPVGVTEKIYKKLFTNINYFGKLIID